MSFQSRSIRLRKLLTAAFGAAALLAAANPAVAQKAKTAKEAASDDTLETVLVTANKRKEDQQKVPISIAAITAETAEKTGVVNGQTLSEVVPGLQMNRQTNGSTPFLRGVGSPSTQAGTEPAVALYVDDVYAGSSAAQLGNYNSIERIEVLKGPQGTLFGRNATGGVIQVFTKNPSQEHKTDFTIGYANYQDVSGAFYTTGKIAEGVSANLSVYGDKQNAGWGSNFTTGNPSYRQHDYGGRTKLLWEPSAKTSVLLNIDYDDYFNQQAVYFRAAPGAYSGAIIGGVNTSIPPPNRYDTNENLDPIAAVKQYGASVKVNHETTIGNFVSISAYRHGWAEQQFAQDGSSAVRLNPDLVYTTKTYTQEFQLISPTDAKIAWVAGLYYLKDSTAVDPFMFAGILAGGGLSRKGAVATQDTDSYSGFVQSTFPITSKANVTAGLRYTSDKRSLTAGRVNIDATGVKSAVVPATNSGDSTTWTSTSGRLAFDYQFTDAMLGYVAFNRGFKSGVYNTILAPSFAPLATPPSPGAFDPPAAPENLDAYTVGFKSETDNKRIRFNAEAFYYKYKNLQLQQVISIPGGGTTTRITNAAKANIKGIDVDITMKPVEHFSVTVGLEYLNGRYDDYTNGQFFYFNAAGGGNCGLLSNVAITSQGTASCVATVRNGLATQLPPNYVPNANPLNVGTWNLSGNKTIQTPPFSANISGTYTIPMASGSLDLTMNYYHTGDYYADPDNGLGQLAPSSQNNDHQGLLNIVNASMTWYEKNDKWSLRLWAKNLTNQAYWSFANETGTITKNTPAPPRTYGITWATHF